MRKHLLVFDLDGTTIDSQGAYFRAADEYSLKNSLPLPDKNQLSRGYAAPDDYDFGWNVSKKSQREHLNQIDYMFNNPAHPDFSHLTPALFPDVMETLKQLKDNGHILAVVTSRPMTAIDHIFRFHNLASLFLTVRSRDDVLTKGLREKPEADMLLSVIDEAGVDKQATFMIGDTVMDIKMARAAGVRGIGVKWGYHPYDLLHEEGAFHILENSLSEIIPMIEKIPV